MHPDVRHIGSISRAHEYTSKRPTVLCEDHSARGILVEPASNVHLRCTTNEGLLQRSQSISIISHHHHHHHVVVSNALALARTHRQQIEDGARAVLANVRARVSRRLVQQERHTTHTRCVSISGDVLAAVAGLGGALDHAPGVEERQRRSSYADARRSIQARRHWSSLDLRALAVVTRMKHRDVVESNPFLH